MKEKWTKTWPKKSGKYWFYGWRFGKNSITSGETKKPELCFVEVKLDASNHPMCVTKGHFLYKAEGATGVWTPAILPALPDIKDIE